MYNLFADILSCNEILHKNVTVTRHSCQKYPHKGGHGEHIRPASLINTLLLLIVHQSKYYTLHSNNII